MMIKNLKEYKILMQQKKFKNKMKFQTEQHIKKKAA